MSFAEKFSTHGDLGMHGVRLPEFEIEQKYYDRLELNKKTTNTQFLEKLCEKGMVDRNILGKENAQKYIDRYKYELNVLDELGFVDYILLIWDIINFCKEKDIPVGYARGSAAGSCVLYLSGVTGIDPLKYNLYFERFVSKARAKKIEVNGIKYLEGSLLPDIDSDICYYRRQEVIEYIQNKFTGKTCKILTVNTLSGKLCIKEVAKIVLEYSEEQTKKLADCIEKHSGIIEDLVDAPKTSEDLRNWLSKGKVEGDMASAQETFDIARKLENLPKNFGVHPSAIVVSHDNLNTYFPVKNSGKDDIVSGFDMKWTAELAVKVDVLGLRSVSVVDEVIKMIGINIDEINFDDPKIYEPLQNLKTPHGLFQIEANTQYKSCQKIKPRTLGEVSDLMALARPGALAEIDGYIKAKETGKIEKVDDKWDAILAESKGMILYQESQMRLLHEIFGFSLEDAEQLRRIVGKKLVDKMPEWKGKVFEASERLKLKDGLAQKYWDSINASAKYSFNKCLRPTTYVTIKGRGRGIMLKDVEPFERVLAYNPASGKDEYVKILDVIRGDGKRFLYRAITPFGINIVCSLEHKFLCHDGVMRKLEDVYNNNIEVVIESGHLSTISDLIEHGFEDVIDLEVDSEHHNFYADGFVVSNSHSVAYATLAATTLYLKFNYPKQFFLALLNMTKHEPDPHGEISKITKELHYFNIKLLSPDLIRSQLDFSIDGDNIRYGLNSVKGVAEKAMHSLLAFKDTRNENKFTLFQSAKQAGLNIGVLSALIQAGAIESLNGDRCYNVFEAQVFNLLTEREKSYVLKLGNEFNYDLFKLLKTIAAEERKDDSGKKPIIKQSRLDTLQKHAKKYGEIYKLNAKNKKLANWYFENKFLGYSHSSTLYDSLKEDHDYLVPLEEFDDFVDNDRIITAGIVIEAKESRSKKTDKPMLRITIADGKKQISMIMFDTKFLKWKESGELVPAEDEIVVISGRKATDTVFLDGLTKLNYKIYTKLSEVVADVLVEKAS